MARPALPTADARALAINVIADTEDDLHRRGLLKIANAPPVRASKESGKAPAIRNNGLHESGASQAVLNHICALKSKCVNSGCGEPSWLVDTYSQAPSMYGKLAAAAIKSNAVNSSVTKRSKTQGATNQTSRINCKLITQAAAAQVVTCAISTAVARATVQAAEQCFEVVNPMATNAANPCTLWAVDVDDWNELLAITMSSRLLFNALPTKLGSGCVITVARELAAAELDLCKISECMGTSNHVLDGICKSILQPGQFQLDAVWASWVLVVYCSCHPDGRSLLRATALTDVDFATATAFEAYGRAEITRRARLEAAQQSGARKRKADDASEGSEVPKSVCDALDDGERRAIASKRKRGSKGIATASTNDSSGVLPVSYTHLRAHET